MPKQEKPDWTLKFPWTVLRTLFGSLSMILLVVCLHSLIYVTFIASKSPDCSKCDQQNEDKNCNNFCNLIVDDFVFVYNLEDRNNVLTYVAVILFLRCIAFFSGFIGVFQYLFFAMIVYLIIHLGLVITFIFTLVFYAVNG